MKHTLSRYILVSALCIATSAAYGADKSTYTSEDGQALAAKVIYEYKPDSLFEVHTHIGYITDISLKKGETVTYIGGGDTKRWLLDQSTVDGVTHVYIKLLRSGMATNMIINTNKHTYRLYVIADDGNYTPIVEWHFPEESSMQKMLEKPLPTTKEEETFLSLFADKDTQTGHYSLKKINRNYKTKSHGSIDKELLPSEIFDDGIRTYIKMPASNKYDMPVLYNVGEKNKIQLVNYRVKNDYFIADRVFRKARLYYTSTSYVDIVPAE